MPFGRDEAGQLWELDASGNPIRRVSGGAQQALPADPLKQGQAQAGLQGQNLNNQGQYIDNRVATATMGDVVRKTRAEATKAETEAAAAQRDFNRGPKLSDAELNAQRDQRTRATSLNTLANQIDRADELFQQGPGSTPWYQGIKDFLPTETNKRLDVAGAQLAQQGLAAFRVPGSGTVTDRDAIMFDRANLPQAGNFDATNSEQIQSIRARVNEELKAMGQPPRWDEKGNPISEDQRALMGAQQRLEQQIAGLPPKAQEIGRQRFYADPRIKKLMGKQSVTNAPRVKQDSGVIDWKDWRGGQ